jgi:hypothetical protein
LDILAPIALLGAILTGIAAGFMFWTSQTASRASRGALFNTERQVALDRAKRAQISALALGGAAAVLLLVNLVASGSAGISISPTETPTRTPRPSPTIAPATREVLIATLAPTPTPTPPLSTAVVVNAGEPGLRLRAAPNGDEIDFLKDGTVLELLPEPQVTTSDGIVWQKVRDPQGREGWVATAYIANQ